MKHPRDDSGEHGTEPARAQMTLVRPSAARDAPSSFPSDLFEQARGRVRLLAGFFVAAFVFDLLIFAGVTLFAGDESPGAVRAPELQWVNLGAALLSAGLWWAAKSPRISASRLHTLGLVYEVIVCFIAAMLTYRQYYLDTGLLPNLTWVPAIVIMFPLIMPGPPRRMLGAALASAATSPLAMFLLDVAGKIDTGDGSAYVPATVSPLFGVAFAYLGARVVYGLGREVAKARAMGSYQLEEKLGQGGMGEVWRARHRLLARPAAIKLIRTAPAEDGSASVSAEALHRFEREAQAIAGLRSPHTVDLFDFGVADDGSFYYAMELLDGMDADALVRRFGPVPAERAVFLLQQVCHSLSEAESRGLVHRDIKPANVFLCRYGEDHDFVKVLDFGIVKTHRDTDEAQTALTGQNVIHGTPAFMAPEQALGHAEIDGRADIYSLGCVAHWLLTGKFVFTADTPTALLMKHISTPPAAPSACTELPIPASLDRLVLSCLEKDPANRPQSARDLSLRLAEVAVPLAWNEARSREWWNRHRPLPAGARGIQML
ncbi:MAG TPA: serine/threonine-protein kinase [Candidatus Krumholzibacteria bacterium]|nr:serine/threonine-protein kinase [Candidatus Krumholzibacteria bacterium]